MPEHSAKVSLVVCTRNRATQLIATLDSIMASDLLDSAEIIVVDNSSSDDTARAVGSHPLSQRKNFRLIVEERLGASHARNAGWRACSAEIVAFVDDDCYVGADYANCAVHAFKDDKVGFVGGRIVLHDPADLNVTTYDCAAGWTIAPGSLPEPGTFQSANLLVRRAALVTVGGFNSKLGAGTPWGCEDLDLVARLSAQGMWGVYDPCVVVRHHHQRRTWKDLEALRHLYARGRGAFYLERLLSDGRRLRTLRRWVRSLSGQARRFVYSEVSGAFTYFCARRSGPDRGTS